jgi:branched-chain amino acid transport system permease protein
MFGQQLVNVMVLGCEYMLVAAGLSLVFGILRIINFVHGAIFVIGTFVTFFVFAEWGINYFVAIVAAILVSAVIAVILERGFFRPLQVDHMAVVIGGLGIVMVIQNVLSVTVAPDAQFIPYALEGVWRVAGVNIAWQRLTIMGVSIVLMAALVIFVQFSKHGKAMRAVAQDPDAASMVGVDIGHIRYLAMIIGCSLAGASGAIMAPIFAADAYGDLTPMLKAFIIVIIGGLGSLPGAIIAAFGLAIVDVFGVAYLGYPAYAIGLGVVVLFLLIKPSGLFGHAE